MKSLPTGKQKFGDIEFEIGEGVLQLGSSNVTTKPNKIEGVKVGRTLKKLHFLQASGYNTTDDTVIGKYVIRYEDKIPLRSRSSTARMWSTGGLTPIKRCLKCEGQGGLGR